MPYQIGPTSGSMEDLKERVGFYPSSVYVQALEDDHGGGLRVVGYPRSVWTFDALSLVDYQALVQTLLGFSAGEYSGEAYIETRDEWDTWTTYRTVMRLPAPADLDRWSDHVRELVLDFVLVEVIP